MESETFRLASIIKQLLAGCSNARSIYVGLTAALSEERCTVEFFLPAVASLP